MENAVASFACSPLVRADAILALGKSDVSTHAVTAMFASCADAERAAQRIVTELRLSRAMVDTSPEAGGAGDGPVCARTECAVPSALLDSLFIPDEDRRVLAEGLRRGCALVSAAVEGDQADRAAAILDGAGAIDLDDLEASWRGQDRPGPEITRDLRSPP